MTLDPQSPRPAVFIAGGIGITPFRSMALQARHDRLARPLCLVYSNRRPEDAAFLEELVAIEREHPAFHLMPTMTGMEDSTRTWSGRRGLIDAPLIQSVAGAVARPEYFLAGPPGMLEAALGLLKAAGVAAGDIRYEEFFGY